MSALPILLYHSIDDEPQSDVARWSVTPQEFAEHMSVLWHGGWRTVPLGELAWLARTGAPWPDRCVAVTFDDGFEDVLTRAMPVMDDMVATVYMTSGWLRDRASGSQAPGRMLAAAQLGEIASAGWEVGVHGHSHVALDAVPKAVAAREITDSKHIVEDVLGAQASGFAYPYGYHDRGVQRLVEDAGFDHAVAVKNTHSHVRDDQWGLARITVERGMSARWLERTLAQPAPRTAPRNERLRTIGWRQVRRARTALDGTTSVSV
jgi:peptidoglycan/xylan/chitin deacetylase (PgdA/CDA1 family)